jgi:hypothetical protein
MFFVLLFRGGRASSAPGADTAATVDRTIVQRPRPAPIEITEPAPPPTWEGRRQPAWARDGSRTISFELRAKSDVPVWMTRVRPALVVRCLSHATDVFVETGSAASIEPQDGTHTVRLQIDDGPVEVQHWSDSVSQQELFAPDGVLLARRLARAHQLRFGFTPYNAKPVVAEFVVEGFDELAPLVGRTCGWSLDHTPAARRSSE